jgi:hypothetical protein
MDYNLIIQIVSVCWLWVNITPIQHFLIVRNWGWFGVVLTCWKCLSLWTGLIVCLVLYINPINAIVASLISFIIEKIIHK